MFKSDTLAHFKNLNVFATNFSKKEIERESNAIKGLRYGDIEYEKLYEDLFEDKQLKKRIGKTFGNDTERNLRKNKLNGEEEKLMVKQYDEVIKKVKEIKEKVNVGRKKLGEIVMKRRFTEEEVRKKKVEFDRKVYALE